ncbi:flavin reductase family protein [Kitasatospora sp. SUK 42]|uniref:flavin reductase family protein n=1 Tax=Kitasatospora sp. SUK 42 TaxID=1588882 RepID=UPI0018CA5F6B|nr:flavin reductase family protein [Kitasatospora sp. SUK 42]MBV2155282.1 flavin reductase family protein [Kitasatospora sp. SUK 42]
MAHDGQATPLLAAQGPPPLPADPATVSPTALREVMSRFATGVVVLTVGGEHIHGMTANAFSSVSLEPPIVLCCIAHSAVMHQAIRSAGHFAVSILSTEQEGTARYFADKSRPLGPEQFEGVDWVPGQRTWAPLLSGALAWLECELDEAYDSGDHSIFTGRVINSSRGDDGSGLLFFDGGFRRIAPTAR